MSLDEGERHEGLNLLLGRTGGEVKVELLECLDGGEAGRAQQHRATAQLPGLRLDLEYALEKVGERELLARRFLRDRCCASIRMASATIRMANSLKGLFPRLLARI